MYTEFINKEIILKDRTLIFLCKFGSHLYGTDTENSDLDFKGVFIPNREEFFLQNYPEQISFSTSDNNSKNSSEDYDIEIYSIHKFFELAKKGETIAIDLLNVNLKQSEIFLPQWRRIHENRNLFYTKQLKAFVGYCKRQASKYGIKGSRIKAVEDLLKIMNSVEESRRVSSIWDKLPINEYSYFRKDLDNDVVKNYECCGKIIQSTSKIGYSKVIFEKFLQQYGERARLARKNKGIDWKAISHAFRAAYELIEIYETGEIKFPLKERKFLLDVKLGKCDFNIISEKLDEIIKKVEKLSKKSNFPEDISINEEKINRMLYLILFEEYVL